MADRDGPVPLWFGRLVEPIYAAAIGRRNARYDSGVGITRLAVPVISVGNLCVGGTGKTPMVMHIVGLLLEAGSRPCIAMRGYRGRASHSGTSRRESDESDAYTRAFADVPVVAQPDRIAGVRELLGAVKDGGAAIDCVVLDDGFQHRRLARDLDLVLVDASKPPTSDRLLPSGWLREPVRNLKRASLVVVTHAEQVDAASLRTLENTIIREHGKPPAAITRHVWTGLRLADAHGQDRTMPLDTLLEKRIMACCAIGNPLAFSRSLRATATPGMVVGEMTLPDHDPFDAVTVQRLIDEARRSRADLIVVTDKDWSKLRHIAPQRWGCPVARPQLQISFDRGGEELRARVLQALKLK